MRWVSAVSFLILAAMASAADDAALMTKQQQTAEKNFETIQTGNRSRAETDHIFVVGSVPDSRLKSLANALEKTYAVAVKGLQFHDNDPVWKGKLAVLVFNDAPNYRSFARQITKRSPVGDETNSAQLTGENPMMGVAAASFKDAATMDAALQHRLAQAMIAARAKTDKLPDWLINGFAKATSNQALPLGTRKKQVVKLGLPATAAWSTDLPAEVRNQVAASVVEYLFYAKTVKPGEFLAAFRPETDQMDIDIPINTILEKVSMTPEKLDAGWRQWLAKP